MIEVPAYMLLSHHARFKRVVVRQKLARLIRLVGIGKLTAHQRNVVKLLCRGWGQTAIAEKLGVHQTSIHKAIFGNLVYHGDYAGCRHGGILLKLYKKCRRDPELLREWLEFEKLYGFRWSVNEYE